MTNRFLLFILALVAIVSVSASCGSGDEKSSATPTPNAQRKTASIEGEVSVPADTDAFGVTIFAEGTSYMALTDRDGVYTLSGLEPGRYLIRAMRADLESVEVATVTVEASDLDAPQPMVTLDMVVMNYRKASATGGGSASDLASVSGRVDAGEGESGGVTVSIEGTRQRTVTLPDGTFDLVNVPPGEYVLLFAKDGFDAVRRSAKLDAGAEIELSPTELKPSVTFEAQPGTIFGRVEMVTADGRIISDFTNVRVTLDGTTFLASPDSRGVYSFADIPPGRYRVGASAPGFLLERKVEVDLSAVPAAEIDLTLVEDAEPIADLGGIFGRVTLEDGTAAGNSGIAVAIAGTSLSAYTNERGDYEFLNVDAGTYDLVASFTGYKNGFARGVRVTGGLPAEAPDIELESAVERPVVVFTSPARGARDVPIEAPTVVTIQFSQKMNMSSVRTALSISPEVGYSVATSGPAQDTVVITLAALPGAGPVLKYETEYTVSIANTAANATGVTMKENYELSFTTGAPMIIATRPADGDQGYLFDFNNSVEVYFNAPIDQESIVADDIRFRPSLPGNPVIRFRRDTTTGWTVLIVQGYGEADTEYRVSIRRSARTIGGQRIGNLPYEFTFKVPPHTTFEEEYGTNAPGFDARERERNRRN